MSVSCSSPGGHSASADQDDMLSGDDGDDDDDDDDADERHTAVDRSDRDLVTSPTSEDDYSSRLLFRTGDSDSMLSLASSTDVSSSSTEDCLNRSQSVSLLWSDSCSSLDSSQALNNDSCCAYQAPSGDRRTEKPFPRTLSEASSSSSSSLSWLAQQHGKILRSMQEDNCHQKGGEDHEHDEVTRLVRDFVLSAMHSSL